METPCSNTRRFFKALWNEYTENSIGYCTQRLIKFANDFRLFLLCWRTCLPCRPFKLQRLSREIIIDEVYNSLLYTFWAKVASNLTPLRHFITTPTRTTANRSMTKPGQVYHQAWNHNTEHCRVFSLITITHLVRIPTHAIRTFHGNTWQQSACSLTLPSWKVSFSHIVVVLLG